MPIRRIYNRAIVDELVRKNLKLPFKFTDDLEVEWAGHPNWYFRMSKFSLPYLKHECVPKTWFLDRVEKIPNDLRKLRVEAFVFVCRVRSDYESEEGRPGSRSRKPRLAIHSAGANEICSGDRDTFGGTKAEVRIMYIWVDELLPVMTIIRMGRGADDGRGSEQKHGVGGIVGGVVG